MKNKLIIESFYNAWLYMDLPIPGNVCYADVIDFLKEQDCNHLAEDLSKNLANLVKWNGWPPQPKTDDE